MDGMPLAASVLLTVASAQGNYVFLWLPLDVALDLGRVGSFAHSLGTPLESNRLFSTARNIYCLSRLKPDKIFEKKTKQNFFF